jgi:cell division septal protein FtsQ
MIELNPPLRRRLLPVFGEALEFKRGLEKVPVKKIQRKLNVRTKHIIFFFLAIAVFFLLLAEAYLYLVGCDDFAVKKTEIACRRDFVGRDIRGLLGGSRFGNLLLLDIEELRDRIEAHRWVKEARVRKVFPSTLKVEITEREPAAILKSGESYLMIDREGVWLEQLAAREDANLPLLLDSASFREDYQDKLGLAWQCLEDLAPGQLLELDALDLSEPGTVSAYLAGQPTRLVLGSELFSKRLAFIRSRKESIESQNGALEYIDLRFDGRVIFKPLPVVEMAATPNPRQEVN